MQQNPWTPPPPPGAGAGAPPNVPNYLVLAILSLLCCWPLAIVAIINAAKVNGKLAAGDIPGAMAASKNAKTFALISIGIGVVLYAISIIAQLANR
jgi:hypothetical protein